MAIDPYKRIKGNKCLYSDTNSVFLMKPLDKKYLKLNLGLIKNEAIPNEASLKERINNDSKYYVLDPIFITPKIYNYKSLKGVPEVVKCKDISDGMGITYNDLKNLYKDLSFQSKTISRIKKTLLNLVSIPFSKNIKGIINKREYIYNANGN